MDNLEGKVILRTCNSSLSFQKRPPRARYMFMSTFPLMFVNKSPDSEIIALRGINVSVFIRLAFSFFFLFFSPLLMGAVSGPVSVCSEGMDSTAFQGDTPFYSPFGEKKKKSRCDLQPVLADLAKSKLFSGKNLHCALRLKRMLP